MSLLRFGPLGDAHEMALIGMFEGEDIDGLPEADLELAAMILVVCEPTALDVMPDGSRVLRDPLAEVQAWRDCGLLGALRDAGVPYEAADDTEDCGWQPGDEDEVARSELGWLRLPVRNPSFDEVLALSWAARMEQEPDLLEGVPRALADLAGVVLDASAPADIRFEDHVLCLRVPEREAGEWGLSPLRGRLVGLGQAHTFTEVGRSDVMRSWTWNHIDGDGHRCTDPDGEPVLCALDWLDLHTDHPHDRVADAGARALGLLTDEPAAHEPEPVSASDDTEPVLSPA